MKQQYIFIKHYGAEAANNSLLRLSDNHYVLFYGFGHDAEMGGSGYNWRKDYDHEPNLAEIKADIEGLINGIIHQRILTGFRYGDMPVYLSIENQMDFRSTLTAPIRFKLGEDEDGTPVYHTFETQEELDGFNKSWASWVNECLNEGWLEKDSVNYADYIIKE